MWVFQQVFISVKRHISFMVGLWSWDVKCVKLYDDFTHCLLCIDCFQPRDILYPVVWMGLDLSVLSPTF